MSQEIESAQGNEASVAAVQWSPAGKSSEEQENTLLRELFDKVSGDNYDSTNTVEQPIENTEAEPVVQAPNSMINRLFDKVHSLDRDGNSDDVPGSRKPVTRITLHQIKAMKAVTAAEFEVAVVVRQHCSNSVTNFWSGIHQMIHRMFAPKPNF